jgi:GR25 family glycosyltransferase involved in LPS biosynthesis
MNQSNFDFLEALFLHVDCTNLNIIIINQTTENNLLHTDNELIKVYNVFEKGLSKSRNLALENATKKLLVIADDDVIFCKNFQENILEAFNTFTNHDGFRFQFLNHQGNLAKKYPTAFQSKLSTFETLNTSSVELVFKSESLKNAKISFDENFGLGTNFPIGEEAIFVSDLIKKGLKIGFVPQVIVSHSTISTGHKTKNATLYYIQSAVFYRIFSKMYLFWVVLKLFFDFKQSKIKFTNVFYLFNQALKGKKAYVNATKL